MIEVFSPAKVNLTLDVFPKKSGANFHELETVYHKLDWGDTLRIERADEFKLEGNFDCPTPQNFIYKAWQLIENPQGVKVLVDKKIPTGAGLGGGSSNAASFVKAYFQLFKLGEVPTSLIAQLGQLGKDIPFFMQDAPCALGTHYGEVITSLDFDFSGTKVYLHFPDFKQPTKEAYTLLKDFSQSQTQKLIKSQNLKEANNTFNQLFEQNNYSKIIPEYLKSKINICGSGSTLYSFEPIEIPTGKTLKTNLL
ncbi:hypothetical protein GW756_03460 [bacterium]|nr:hypothetical protein [bacterium]NCQ55424.1 hypothetical protein [Candidatus Parcubacteria bacterium]NCS67786.1 hypothetical protein [Candidatus Peregrinibacteria bacterium]NCS96400.1 hypothetical protein [bacterium]